MSHPSHCALYALIALVGCGPTGASGRGESGGTGGSGAGGGGSGGGPPPGGPFTDFPPDPVIDGAAPTNAASLFGAGTDSGGPCLVEPELGALIPQNWLRLRLRWEPSGGQNLFEIRIHADNQLRDYLIYTDATTWTFPKDVWSNLVIHSYDTPLTISVRGVSRNGGTPALGSHGAVTIARALAGGAIVYWTTSNGTALKGFHVGEESVQEILRPPQAQTACVGCHTSTPDGKFAAFTGAAADPDDETMFVGLRSVDGAASEPSYLSAAGRMMLARTLQEAPAFSAAHFMTGDRIVLSMFGGSDIIWTELESGASGTLARTGDRGFPASVNFSHDGTRVAYCSSTQPVVSGVQTSGCDLYTVPYDNRRGGTATPLAGASEAAYGEFYPAFSPDDRWIAFNRAGAADDTYANPQSEIFVVSAAGGSAVRLAANDPPVCSGRTSPGLTNSWPKWSPTVTALGPRRIYWLTFSSTRRDGTHPQLYVAAVAVDEIGNPQSYPALYLWNQPEGEGNHTPAWDQFDIPVP